MAALIIELIVFLFVQNLCGMAFSRSASPPLLISVCSYNIQFTSIKRKMPGDLFRMQSQWWSAELNSSDSVKTKPLVGHIWEHEWGQKGLLYKCNFASSISVNIHLPILDVDGQGNTLPDRIHCSQTQIRCPHADHFVHRRRRVVSYSIGKGFQQA